MPRRLALSIGFTPDPETAKDIIQRVKIAEEVGVEAVFTAETWGRDQFSLLTRLASRPARTKSVPASPRCSAARRPCWP